MRGEKNAACAQNVFLHSTPGTEVSEKPSKVISSSATQSNSFSIKKQLSATKRILHTSTSAHSSDKSVPSRSMTNTSSAKTTSGSAANKSVSEKPVQLTPQPEIVAVEIPSEAVAEIPTTPVSQSVIQSSSVELEFEPNVLTSPIPANLQSCASIATNTDPPGMTKTRLMLDVSKLINLCASAVNISGIVPTLVGQQLTGLLVDASETCDSRLNVADALDIINNNITAHMVGLCGNCILFCDS